MKHHVNALLSALLLLICCSMASSADAKSYDEETGRLLQKLDRMIDQKEEFHARRNARIDSLKQLAASRSGRERAEVMLQIFDSYSHYQVDSAQVCLDRLLALPEVKADRALSEHARICQGEILAVSGLYAEAEHVMSQTDHSVVNTSRPELLLAYFRTQRTLYGWMSDYTQWAPVNQSLTERTQSYRDSILSIEKPGLSYDLVAADKAVVSGKPSEAVGILLPYLSNAQWAADPYVNFILAQAYHALGQHESCIEHLAMAAIADLERGITEYQALPLLAQALFEQGEVERPYHYLICSMEDANLCRARLRAVEISNIFPIINKAYKHFDQQRTHTRTIFIYALAALLILLLAVVVYLRKQMRRLSAMRRMQSATNAQLKEANAKLTSVNREMADTNNEIQEANEKLRTTNTELHETYARLRMADKVKEEYIARYLNRCRDYMDEIEENRRRYLRMLKDHKTEELLKNLKSDTNSKEEQERFYADFDAAFLTLFPDFIEHINAMLPAEDKIKVKSADRLTTELRIFALIRLGVTDTNRIAHFLNCSTATIYSYRSKLRNRIATHTEEFEDIFKDL